MELNSIGPLKSQGGDSSERLEFEGVVTTSWEDALAKLNEKISELLNEYLFLDPHTVNFESLTNESPALMALKKRRTSYRYDERPDGSKFPCTGSQVDFDEWYEINGHDGAEEGKPGQPILITVDVEGKTLNGDTAGLTPDEARRVPSVENCVWCLSLPENGGYNLFKMVEEKWPPRK